MITTGLGNGACPASAIMALCKPLLDCKLLVTMTSQSPTQGPAASISDQAIAWFVRMQANNVSAEERTRFDIWYQSSPEHAHAYEQTRQLWQLTALPAERVQRRIHAETANSSVSLINKKRALRLPYAFSLACLCLILWMKLPNSLQNWQSDYHTAPGERLNVTLADGSRITLNTDTALAVRLSDARRGIDLLRGEAYFEVAPNKSRPFIVHAGQISAQAVGTEFSVNRQADRLEVSVNEGSVAVRDEETSEVLHASQNIRYYKNHWQPVTQIAGADNFAWRNGQVVFKRQPLATVIDEVNRYRRGRITVANPALANRVISGVFNTADQEAVVDALQATLHAKAIDFPGDWVLLY